MESIKGPNKLINLEYGGQGHEQEYVLTLRKNPYAEAENIPTEWEGEIKNLLGEGWSVMDRGHRIEIAPPGLKNNEQIQERINEVITEVFLGIKKTEKTHTDHWQEQVNSLKSLNQKLNQGRGFSVLTMITEDLERGDPYTARINADQQSDKWTWVPNEAKEMLIKELFKDFKAPWENKDNFYDRLSQRQTIMVDTRLNQNQSTMRGVENKLIEKGYTPHFPSLPLTVTRFSSLAKFDTVEVKRPDEVLDHVLTNARLTTHKMWTGKVLVRIYDQGQKDALVFLKSKTEQK